MKTNKIFIIVIFCLISSLSFAQQYKITGTWTLKERKAVSGPQYRNALPDKYTITRTKDSLTVQGSFNGEIPLSISFAFNGQVVTTRDPSGRKINSVLKWSADHQTLTLISKYSSPDNERTLDFTRIRTIKLLGADLSLDVRSEEANPDHQSWEAVGTYAKQ